MFVLIRRFISASILLPLERLPNIQSAKISAESESKHTTYGTILIQRSDTDSRCDKSYSLRLVARELYGT
ncbi:hypothetical protein D3C76_1583050 [compost metagenome]